MPFRSWRNIMAAGNARMADNGHDKLATTTVEGSLQPCPLSRIEGAQNAGVDAQQCKIAGLQLEKRRALRTDADLVQVPQPCRLCQELVDTTDIGGGESEIRLHATFQGSARRLGLQEIRIERLQCVEPVVISWDRIDRLSETLECEIKFGFVIF